MRQGAINSNQRVGIFVDVSNLYHSAKNLYQGRVNYAELIKSLVGDRQLIRAMAYVVKSEGVEAQHPHRPSPGQGVPSHPAAPVHDEGASTNGGSSEASFFEALEKAGFELRMKDLQIFAGGAKKGDWDVGIAVDAIRMMPSLDVVILVTGDGDFVPLVNYLKWAGGCMVEVASFRRSASSKIVEAADEFINIEAMPRAIMKTRYSRRSAQGALRSRQRENQ